MSRKPSPPSARRQWLAQALQLIRRARGLRTLDLAHAMALGQRTYEYIEAGKSGVDFEHITAFAAATGSDAHAIAAAGLIGSPAFALRAADNKLVTALLIGLQELDQDLGDDIALLDASTCIAVFNEAFAQLVTEARRRAFAQQALAGAQLASRATITDEDS